MSLLLTAFSAAAGGVAWTLLDNLLINQAEERAESIANLASYMQSPVVRQEMEELTGYRIFVEKEPELERPGLVRVTDRHGRTITVDYFNEAYRDTQQTVLIGTFSVMGAGTCLALFFAWFLAKSIAQPIEILATEQRRMGQGDLDTPVRAPGSGEIRELGIGLERMRDELRVLQKRVRDDERLRTLGTFTATIAHEVRNPLSAIQVSLQLLQKHDLTTGDREIVAHALREMLRLDLIVDELLAYSRGITVQRSDCDMAMLCDETIDLLSRQAAHVDVVISRQGTGTFYIDGQRMKQLLLNLLLNAIHALHADGGEVMVSIGDDFLRVADNGPGIQDDMRGQLFEAFTTDKPAGTGLGLHIAHAIAVAHDACLELEETETGASFLLSGLRS